MVIFHSYVSLPEGIHLFWGANCQTVFGLLGTSLILLNQHFHLLVISMAQTWPFLWY